ncbi:DUF6457 domain-containing protein [Arthrobacter sp. NPDC056727]|uniref:DUF6457 domain-containing protein n=1 Tax=Arthrobacter sp. NPDC056727 TaxID=3345927 RepID=UPI0036708688
MAVDDEMQVLNEWCEQLATALQIPDLDVDQELLLDLARKSADSVIHAAAPVTAFMVGYVAGHQGSRDSAGSGDFRDATARAAEVAFELCRNWTDSKGNGPGGAASH